MLPDDAIAAREHAYSPSRWARDFEATLARQAALGERLRQCHPPKRLAYGAGWLEGVKRFRRRFDGFSLARAGLGLRFYGKKLSLGFAWVLVWSSLTIRPVAGFNMKVFTVVDCKLLPSTNT